MKSNHKLKYKNNHYCYFINQKEAQLLKSSDYNLEALILWNSILKNDALVDSIILSCGLKDISYILHIVTDNDEDNVETYEINPSNLKNILNFVLNTLKIDDSRIQNAIKILKSLDEKYIMQNLDVSVTDGITINKILTEFSRPLTNEECINKFGMSAQYLCEVLEKIPFKFKSSSLLEETILNRLDIPSDEKINIYENIMNFRYKYETDKVSAETIKTNENFIDNFSINPNIKEEILSELPTFFSNTQKIYYIYRRLCQILTYDEAYYAGNQKRTYNIRHDDVNRISQIDEDNNIIVCYEATVLLACFCKELLIPFRIKSYDNQAYLRNYGKEHLDLVIKVDDYIIKMDPTTGLINSDLAYEKTRGYVRSFVPLNETKRTLDKFDEELSIADAYVKLKSQELGYLNLQNKKIKLNKRTYDNEDLKTRLKELINIISTNHLAKVDSLRYILDCYKIIFSNEFSDFVKIDFYTYYDNKSKNRVPTAVNVIIYNNDGLSEKKEENAYIVIIDNCPMSMDYKRFLEFKRMHFMTRIDSSVQTLDDDDNELELK